jgi:hypothetical protein
MVPSGAWWHSVVTWMRCVEERSWTTRVRIPKKNVSIWVELAQMSILVEEVLTPRNYLTSPISVNKELCSRGTGRIIANLPWDWEVQRGLLYCGRFATHVGRRRACIGRRL